VGVGSAMFLMGTMHCQTLFLNRLNAQLDVASSCSMQKTGSVNEVHIYNEYCTMQRIIMNGCGVWKSRISMGYCPFASPV